MLEILWENDRLEFFLVPNDEAIPVVGPAYCITVLLVLRQYIDLPPKS